MSNFLLATTTLTDAATITMRPESVDPVYPLENIVADQPRDICRTANDSDTWFVVDLGAAYAVNCVALLYTNADSNVTVQIVGATTEAKLTTTPDYDSGTISHWPDSSYTSDISTWGRNHAIHIPSSAQNYRWWRIDIRQIDTALDYYEVGRIVIDAAIQQTKNISIGATLGYTDFSFGVDTPGATYRYAGKQKRVIAARFDWRTEAEAIAGLIRQVDRQIGAGKSVFAIMDPASDNLMETSIYGYITELGAVEYGEYYQEHGISFSKSYTIEEFEKP